MGSHRLLQGIVFSAFLGCVFVSHHLAPALCVQKQRQYKVRPLIILFSSSSSPTHLSCSGPPTLLLQRTANRTSTATTKPLLLVRTMAPTRMIPGTPFVKLCSRKDPSLHVLRPWANLYA